MDGSLVTSISGSNIGSGTVAAAYLPVAGAAADGVITTGAQTLAGNKTFNGVTSLSGGVVLSGIQSSTATSFISATPLTVTAPVVLLKATTAIALTCITAGTNGQVINILFVATANGVNNTVTNNGTCTAPATKIFTSTAGNLTITANANLKGTLRLIYLDAASSGIASAGWFVLQSSL